MVKKSFLLVFVLTIIFSFSTTALMAQKSESAVKKPQKPFLITGNLPHLAIRLQDHLNDPALHLTKRQERKLLAVKKDVVANVQNIGKQVFPLEKQVAEGIFAGKTPDELRPTVEKIAELKAEATMVQLQCISDFRRILDKQQLAVLKY